MRLSFSKIFKFCNDWKLQGLWAVVEENWRNHERGTKEELERKHEIITKFKNLTKWQSHLFDNNKHISIRCCRLACFLIYLFTKNTVINKCKRNNERQQDNFLDLRFYFISSIFNNSCVSKIKISQTRFSSKVYTRVLYVTSGTTFGNAWFGFWFSNVYFVLLLHLQLTSSLLVENSFGKI